MRVNGCIYVKLWLKPIFPFFLTRLLRKLPIPVPTCSKAWVGGRSLAGIVGFEYRLGHGYIALVSIVYCQVEFSESG